MTLFSPFDYSKQHDLESDTVHFEYESLEDDEAFYVATLLKGNEVLTDLSVKGNSLTADGATVILRGLQETNRKLQKLSLGENCIGCDAAPVLVEFLKSNHPSLEELDLQYNRFDDEAGAQIVLALENNTVLRYLDLCKNNPNERSKKEEEEIKEKPPRLDRIGDKTALALARVLQKNRTLEWIAFSSFGLLSEDTAGQLAHVLWESNFTLQHMRLHIYPSLMDDPSWQLMQVALQRNRLQLVQLWQHQDSDNTTPPGLWSHVLFRLSNSTLRKPRRSKEPTTTIRFGLDLMYYVIQNKPGMLV